jgi:hypothetical protein
VGAINRAVCVLYIAASYLAAGDLAASGLAAGDLAASDLAAGDLEASDLAAGDQKRVIQRQVI